MAKHPHPVASNACRARPWWIKAHAHVADRILCVKRASHTDEHQNGQDHRWDRRKGR